MVNNVVLLHQKLTKAGFDIVGVSTSERGTVNESRRVDFVGSVPENASLAYEIADNFEKLSPTTDRSVIYINPPEGEVGTAIIDTEIETGTYVVYDGSLVERDSQEFSGAAIEFSFPERGRFIIEVCGLNYQTGYVTVDIR